MAGSINSEKESYPPLPPWFRSVVRVLFFSAYLPSQLCLFFVVFSIFGLIGTAILGVLVTLIAWYYRKDFSKLRMASALPMVWSWKNRFFNRTFLIAILTGSCILFSIFKPLQLNSAARKIATQNLVQRRNIYQLAFDESKNLLFGSITRESPGGILVHNLQNGTSRRVPASMVFTNFGTLIPEHQIYVLHGNSQRNLPFRLFSNEQPNISTSFIYDYANDRLTARDEPDFKYLRSSFFAADRGMIFLADKDRSLLRGQPMADFLSGKRHAPEREFSLNISNRITGIQAGIEKCLLHAARNLAYCQAEGTNFITEINLADSTTRHAFIPLIHWDIALNEKASLLYVVRPLFGGFSVLDIQTMQIRKNVFTGGGLPRSIAFDRRTNSILVGQYFGGNLLILNADNYEITGRISACSAVRSYVFPSHGSDVIYSDACGVHRAKL